MSDAVDAVIRRLDESGDAAVARLCELLRIPSISTDPAHDGECRRAAAWLADDLASIGFDASVRETGGKPMVVGHHPGPEGAPHVLYYGHYDVQPAEPLELWDHPPFEPAIVDGPRGRRLVARGAVDDKGQLMTFVEAFRAWKDTHGRIPVTATVLLEGEEESGSVSLEPFLHANADELRADVVVVSDTGMWDVETPAITTALRGMAYVEFRLFGPSTDLHSGMYGGAVPNPINVLTRILGGLHDDAGRVRVPGFYDDVRELDPEQAAQWKALDFDEAGFLGGIGLETPFGEAGRTTLERVWSRPTLDINGIVGGYTGVGAKTVIPAMASAKLSCRLVPDQDPRKVVDGIRSFVEQHLPPDCRVEIEELHAAPATRIPTGSTWLKAARDGLVHVFGRDPVLVGCGGSIPIVGSFREILGMDSLLVGFGLEDDRVHAPNEKFELRCFHNGAKAHAAILQRLAEAV